MAGDLTCGSSHNSSSGGLLGQSGCPLLHLGFKQSKQTPRGGSLGQVAKAWPVTLQKAQYGVSELLLLICFNFFVNSCTCFCKSATVEEGLLAETLLELLLGEGLVIGHTCAHLGVVAFKARCLSNSIISRNLLNGISLSKKSNILFCELGGSPLYNFLLRSFSFLGIASGGNFCSKAANLQVTLFTNARGLSDSSYCSLSTSLQA